MDVENLEGSEEMGKSGSFACLSKETISSLFDCTISCTIFAATIYILILIIKLAQVLEISPIFLAIGYISLICFVSSPTGLYGSRKGSFCALFTFFILTAYHLYGLIVYIGLNVYWASTNPNQNNSTSFSQAHRRYSSGVALFFTSGQGTLHNVTTFLYTLTVFLSLVVVCFKIISKTKEIGAEKSQAAGQQLASLDSNQLLTVCFRIRENMSVLGKSIKMVQLRLTTMSYINKEPAPANQQQRPQTESSIKFFENLIELSSQSDEIAQLMDQLRKKLAESLENSIDYEIASQQLVFFTNEWFENLAPKLNETYEMALIQRSFYQRDPPAQKLRGQELAKPPAKLRTGQINNIDRKVNGALLRLRDSMRENERLIGTISNNIQYTRTVIDAIYDSVQSTKLGLEEGGSNASESANLVRLGKRNEMFCYSVLYLVAGLAIVFLVVYLTRPFFGKYLSLTD